jgi:hypothetical protein
MGALLATNTAWLNAHQGDVVSWCAIGFMVILFLIIRWYDR